MNNTIKIFGENTHEYKRLDAAAKLVNSEFDVYNATAKVSDEWFDYAGGVKFTTLVVGQYQALNPLQQAKITTGSLKDFTDAVAAVIETHRARMNMLTEIRYGLQQEVE
jgi:hypothetical protein